MATILYKCDRCGRTELISAYSKRTYDYTYVEDVGVLCTRCYNEYRDVIDEFMHHDGDATTE